MDDDFNTPKALAALFDMVSKANKLIDTKDETEKLVLREAMDALGDISDVFGFAFKQKKLPISEQEIKKMIEMRNEARRHKDFKKADKIRDDLDRSGIILEDQKDGTTWRTKDA